MKRKLSGLLLIIIQLAYPQIQNVEQAIDSCIIKEVILNIL